MECFLSFMSSKNFHIRWEFFCLVTFESNLKKKLTNYALVRVLELFLAFPDTHRKNQRISLFHCSIHCYLKRCHIKKSQCNKFYYRMVLKCLPGTKIANQIKVIISSFIIFLSLFCSQTLLLFCNSHR